MQIKIDRAGIATRYGCGAFQRWLRCLAVPQRKPKLREDIGDYGRARRATPLPTRFIDALREIDPEHHRRCHPLRHIPAGARA